jgi:transcriptional regulator GlxA family with amidase domain
VAADKPLRVGLVLFDGAEELDWAGPYDVFCNASIGGEMECVTVADVSPVTCAKGLRVLPDHNLDDAPDLDIIMVPGGKGTRAKREDPVLLAWLRERGQSAKWVTSVCTGAMVLDAAGFLDGRRVTSHWGALDELQEQIDESGSGAQIVRGERFVVDGKLATSAGVSAGIDLALWLVGELLGEETGLATALFMEYDPKPQYDISELRGF